MPDLSILVDLISNVGYPIAMSFIIFKFMKEEQAKTTEAIQNNTQAITRLLERLTPNMTAKDVNK